MRLGKKNWFDLAGGLILVGFVAFLGYWLTAWTGFPKGADVYARVTRIVYIKDFFPHIFWQYHWANGLPTFKSEAPLFYVTGAILAQLLSLAPEVPLFIIGFATFCFIGWGVFGFVRTLTENWLAGMLAALLALSSFSIWSWMVFGGIYPRIFGVGFSMLALWRAAVYLRALREQEKKADSQDRLRPGKFVWLVVTLAGAITAHLLMGFFVCIAIFLLFLSFPISFKLRVRRGALVFLASFCLAGFFLLPAVINFGGGEAGRFIGVISPVIPATLYSLYDFAGMGPFILPLLIIFSILNTILSRRQKGSGADKFYTTSAWLMFFLFTTYALVGYTGLSGRYYYINGFIPLSATLFMALYGSLLVGLLVARLMKVSRLVFSVVTVALVTAVPLSTYKVGLPLIKNDPRMVNIHDTSVDHRRSETSKLYQLLEFSDPNDLNHRFAAYEAAEAVWFNVFYKIPQVRDYYGQGILNPDWRYWFEQAIWNEKEFSIEEAKAALDWYAVRWFSYYETDPGLPIMEAYSPRVAVPLGGVTAEEVLEKSQNRYLHSPEFKLVSYGRTQYDGLQEEFEVLDPSPILSATRAASVLFIGQKQDYNLLFTALTFDNYGSQSLIPVLGASEMLDDYLPTDLSGYKAVFLYHYDFEDPERAKKLLTDYLAQGGSIYLESSGSPLIPGVTPVSILETAAIEGGEWQFEARSQSILTNVDLKSFSPPLYEGAAWKIETGAEATLAPWAKPVLLSGGKLLFVSGEMGSGRVVWTGFNFLYHLSNYKNPAETKLFYQTLDYLLGEKETTIPQAEAKFINPQRRELTIRDLATGVLFRENFYPQWRAYLVEGEQKQLLPIRLAGPGMMYVSLPAGTGFPAKVVFAYRLSAIEILGWILTIGSFVGLASYSLGLRVIEKLVAGVGGKSLSPLTKAKNWWHDEEA